MKTGIVAAIMMLAFCVATGNAAEAGMSHAKLSKLGLASMAPASDAAGMEVRGQGKVFISGAHIALSGPSSSSNSFGAGVERTPRALAFGNGASLSEYSILVSGGQFFSFNAIAIGSAAAYAP